jgi:hypothetical protein
VQDFLEATDAAQAGTLAWGVTNLKGLSDAGRIESMSSILEALPRASDDVSRARYAWAIGRIAAIGFEARTDDLGFQDFVSEAERSLRRHESDAGVAAVLQRLVAQLRELGSKKNGG